MLQAAKVSVRIGFAFVLSACVAQIPGSDPAETQVSAQQQALARSKVLLCNPQQCGPQLGMPNTQCSDGITVAGPTGRCLHQSDGSCGWEVIACPAGCASSDTCAAGEYCTVEDGDCNPAPGCAPGKVCIQLCYGVCARKPVDPCARKACGNTCTDLRASPHLSN
jgi:hypothetical protein